MDSLPIKDLDLATYGGLVLAVALIIETVKRLWKKWAKGKEAILAVAFSYIIGVAAKLSISGAYASVSWIYHVVLLLFVAVGAMIAHDKAKEILKKPPE